MPCKICGSFATSDCQLCNEPYCDSHMKLYTVKKAGMKQSVAVCYNCLKSLGAFSERKRGQWKGKEERIKVGKIAKKTVATLGAVGLMVLMLIFKTSLWVLKQVLKAGKEGAAFEEKGEGMETLGEEAEAEPEVSLDDFDPEELKGWEAGEEGGELEVLDGYVEELYSSEEPEEVFGEEEKVFGEEETSFLE